jgi:ferredoxin-NADP reductase
MESSRLVWRPAEIIAVRDEAAHARSLVLQVEGWQPHKAGQHVDVRLTAADGYQAQRSYSISSAPLASHAELLVDCVPDGEVSPYLAREARVGDRFELRGIAPLASILAHRAVASRCLPTQVLYSVRTTQDIIFKERLEAWSRDDPALAVSLTLTRSAPADWTGYRRRIDAAMLREVSFEMSDMPLAYVCGPTTMVEAAADALVRVGYPAERIRTERFGPSGEYI